MVTLQNLIDALERLPEDAIASYGFKNAHSYRVEYSILAFEPAPNVRMGDMLQTARAALNKTFQGYKGGDYLMESDTSVVLARPGVMEHGEEITSALLREWRREATEHQKRQLVKALAKAFKRSLFSGGKQ